MEDDTLSTTPIITDPYIPVDTDGEPLLWEGNDAHIEGLLEEVKKHCIRNGLFISFFEHHAVSLSNGKIAIDSVQSASYILGLIADPRDFDDTYT
jgi:hypothetical protein